MAGQESKSIADLQADLFAVLYDRGRVWRNCLPRVDAQGNATVSIDVPDPHEIVPKDGKTNVLYVFEGESAATRLKLKPEKPGLSFYELRVGTRDELKSGLNETNSAEATLANNRRVLAVIAYLRSGAPSD